MALLLPKQRAIFLHVPKTGGNFVVDVLKRLTVTRPIGYKHSTIDLIGKIAYENYFIFCFTREPAEWYRSYFQYRVGKWGYWETHNLWHPCWEIDPHCASDDFEDFARKVMAKKGYLKRLYQRYTEVESLKTDFIGNTANLRKDLAVVLRKLDITFQPYVLERLPKVNACQSPLKIPDDLRQEINENES